MKRRTAWLAGAAALATAAGTGVGVWRAREADRSSADVWLLRFERPDGALLPLRDLRGKPLLVNFWATWCPPCVAELPLLDAFANDQPGWQVLGLAVDQPAPVREFLARHPVRFPIGMAGLEGVALSRQLGNRGGGLPFSLVLDSRGGVAARRIGAIDATDLAGWAGSVR